MATLSFDELKKKISLPDFMELYGFINHKSGTKNYPKMKNEQTGELFIIKKNEKGYYTFFDPVNEIYKGATVVDFVRDKHNTKSFKEISKLLNDYVSGKSYVIPSDSSYNIQTTVGADNKFDKELHGLGKLHNYDFIKSRGLDSSIINDPMFKGKVLESVVLNKGKRITNTAFPMQGSDGKIVAISKRNVSFKGIAGEKSLGVWLTNDPSKGGKIDRVYIMESAIDCISHYDINRKYLKDLKIRYISTEGDFNENQVSVISKIINVQKPNDIVFGQDNDIAGEYEITKLLKNLKILSPDKSNTSYVGEHIHIECYKSKLGSFVEFNFDNYGAKADEIFKLMEDKFSTFNSKLKGISAEETPFKVNPPVVENNNAIIKVDFVNHILNWETMNKYISSIKYKDISMQREKAIANDFNEDLQNKIETPTPNKPFNYEI